MDNKSHRKPQIGYQKPGTVHFGAENIGGLYTPFIRIVNRQGITLTLTADGGVPTQAEAADLCQFLFDVLSNPKDPEFYGQQGKKINDDDTEFSDN